MSRLTVFLAKLIGLFGVLIALEMIVQKDAMIGAVTQLIKDPPSLLLAGVIALGTGLAIVLGHNVWTGRALAVVVTIVGWLSLFKGLALLLVLSPTAAQAYFAALHYQQFYYAYAGFTLLLGAYLTYGAFSAIKLLRS